MMETRRVCIGARSFAVDLYGAGGEAVLLLHGIPGWRGTWRGVAERLASRSRVVAPDLLGFGDSDEPLDDFHAAGQARSVLGLLDALSLDHVHVVGFDFGGPTAIMLYHLAPERIRSLSLAATNVFTDTPIPLPLRVARVPGLGALAFRAFFGRFGLRMMWRAAAGDRQAFPSSRYEESLRSPRGISWTRRIFLASMRDLPGRYRVVEATLPHIHIPRLVLWGDRDPFFPVDVARRTGAALGGARLILLPGCGHFVPEERAGQVADHVLELVGGTSRGLVAATRPAAGAAAKPREEPQVHG